MSPLVLITILGIFTWPLVNSAHIKLTVYYEALSKPSQDFIVKKLYPTVTALGGVHNSWLDIDLVPYGLSKTTWKNTPITICHNGKRECQENKLHSCALRKLIFSDALTFINCSLSNMETPDGSVACGKMILGIDFKKVATCAQSWEGDILLAANGITTLNLEPPLDSVPKIYLSGHFNTHAFDPEEEDWVALLCQKWKAGGVNLPPLCEGKKVTK